jgi:hypothetical protein
MSKERSFLLRSRKDINHRQDSPRKMDIIGGILPVDTMEASGRKIGRDYLPRRFGAVTLKYYIIIITILLLSILHMHKCGFSLVMMIAT